MTGRLLAITGGHRFDHDAFGAMLDAVSASLEWEWAHATQPAAQRWLRPEHGGTWDAIVLYDIPGLTLTRGAEPVPVDPPADVRQGVMELLAVGQGMVLLHHALAGWPTWDAWAEVLGGRFLYAPGTLRGADVPASGYRMDHYRVDVAAPGHPVCRDVEAFDVDDELYLCPIFDDRVQPLLTTPAALSASSMIDTHREVRDGVQVSAADQRGSNLVGWSREEGASRLVYLLPGHGPSTMTHPQYRRLLTNACGWVAGSTVTR